MKKKRKKKKNCMKIEVNIEQWKKLQERTNETIGFFKRNSLHSEMDMRSEMNQERDKDQNKNEENEKGQNDHFNSKVVKEKKKTKWKEQRGFQYT